MTDMITEKQMKSLPKGTYSNTDLAIKFKNHGKKSREILLPVDSRGNLVPDITKAKDFSHMQKMRLNRQRAKMYGKV